jgi:Mg-chelatase subunit ChlD
VKPRGGTGLYDTTLAAYRDARRHWTPGRINLVLVMTDGRNEDEESIGRSRLLAELAELQDPRRPLPIVFIGLGKDVDPDELETIAEVTGGQVFRSPT